MTAFLLLSLMACRDDGLVVYETPPIVSIETPADGASFYEGQEVLFTAVVAPGGTASVTDLTTRWVMNDSPLCDSTEVPPDGVAICTGLMEAEGEYIVQVKAVDPSGATDEDKITIHVKYNNPPTVEIQSPSNGEVFGDGQLVVFQAQILDPEDEPTELAVTLESNVEGLVAGVPESPSSAGDWAGGTQALSAGSHLLTITATDSVGKTGQDTVTILMNNRPSAPTVAISPETPVSEEALVATITSPAIDPEGDSITHRYDWYVDGNIYSSTNAPTVPLGVTKRGEYWEVQVFANDGYSDSAPGSDNVTIGNSAPSIDSVTITPSGAGTLDDLTCTPVGWNDPEGDGEDYDFVWYHNSTEDTDETTDTFPHDKHVKGDELRCEVTPSDQWAIGDTVSSSTLTIQNTPPTQPTVIIDPTAPEPEDSLFCDVLTLSTDDDDDSIEYYYAWYVNGVLNAETSNVLGADQTEHGDVVECEVIPNDGEDDGTSGTYTVNITDATSPDPPVLDDPDPYVNEDYVELTGTCEADCDLTYYFTDATGSWTEAGTCESDGTLTHQVYLTRGYETTGYATCTDDAGNTSGNSNTVTMQSCSVEDTYENSSGYGDTGANAINEWATFSDDGSTSTVVTITANALTSSDEDWYVISATDGGSSEERFNLAIEMTSGTSTYSFDVYKGSSTTAIPTPSVTSPSGYATACTEFEYYNEDNAISIDGASSTYHATASPSYLCGSTDQNVCPDYSDSFYIKVTRNGGVSDSCDHYELDVSMSPRP